jgi:ribonuclease H2 subunit A
MSLEMPAHALSAAMGSGINLNVLSHAMICALVSQAASLFCVVGVFCDTVGPEQTLAGKIRSVCPAGPSGAACEVTVSAKADSLFPIVSAASIVAKVERDRLLSLLHAKCAEEGV